MSRRSWIATGLVIAVGTVVLLAHFRPSGVAGETGYVPLREPIGLFSEDSSGQPEFPVDWTASETDLAKATLRVTLPQTTNASSINATAYYLSPDLAAAAVTYPLVNAPTSEVRQDYIMVFESAWTRGKPGDVFLKWLDETKTEGASLIDISGVPVIAVQAHSPSDLTGENPSLYWFVVGSVEFQVSGGDNADDLIAIVKDIIARAS